MILGSVQPAYLAWIPFFQRMLASDVFVYLDDVEYSKNSFHNRNGIKTAQGKQLLTVPVQYKGNSTAFIKDMPIAEHEAWAKKHWRAIELNYRKAPFFSEVACVLEPLYQRTWTTLGDLNVALLECFRCYFKIDTPCYRSSELAVPGEGNEKLVNLCKRLQAQHFLVKPNTEHYHPPQYFEERGIKLALFEPPQARYPQLYGDFIPNLSVLDLAMNCGSAGPR